MKFIKGFFLTVLILLILAIVGLKITGNGFLIKGVWVVYMHGETSATIDDARFFDTRTIKAPEQGQAWELSPTYNYTGLTDSLKRTLEVSESVAFLVVQEDKLEHEEYWDGYSSSSQSNSFSMAKSMTTMLVQIAIQKGLLKGWNDKVSDYLSELKGEYKDELELRHLSTMTGGLKWNEHYKNPFDITAKAYYGANVEELLYKEVPIVDKPGLRYEYQSGATQYLALVLKKATGKSLSELTSEWLWKPMGAEHDALWNLDDEGGTELAYCCFNSNIRDFARFGKLLLNQGNWEGTQILDSAFIKMATQAQYADFYGYSFWIDNQSHGTKVFYMRGILGQYIIVVPERDLVIVRLGKHRLAKGEDNHPMDFHVIVEEVLKSFK